jgi:hypothetical protein
MLGLLGNEGLRDPEQVVAENRHFRQGISGSDGLPSLIQDFRRWNLHTIRPQAFNLVGLAPSHDYKSLSVA